MQQKAFILCLCLLGCLYFKQITAQESGLISPSDSGETHISMLLDGSVFFRNNEYFNDYQEGYTLPGFHTTPQLQLNFRSRVFLRGGFYLIRYNGQTNRDRIHAVLNITFKPNPLLTISAGTLKGGKRRGLPDPVYHREKSFTDPIEEGLEIRYNHPLIHSQVWLDWKTYIQPGDSVREEFFAGISGGFRWIDNDQFTLRSPFGITASHKGGQISSYDEPMITRYNLILGFAGRLNPGLWKPVFRLNAYAFVDNSPVNPLPYRLGRALDWKAGMRRNNLEVTAGHWNGVNYYSPAGNPLFHNVSQYDFQAYDPVRSIWLLNAEYTVHLVKPIELTLDAGVFYEHKYKRADHYISLSFTFSEETLFR